MEVLTCHPNFIPKSCNLTIIGRVNIPIDAPRPARTGKTYIVIICVNHDSLHHLGDVDFNKTDLTCLLTNEG